MTKTDLIIIGSGPGGYKTAEYAAKHGLQVIIFEDKHAGGTCLNEGCIPTKAFCHHAEVIDELKESDALGLDNLSYELNFKKIADRKAEIVKQLQEGVKGLMSMPGIQLVMAKAEFKDANTVVAGGEEYTADNIIIATGSHSKMPPVEGIDNEGVFTSTELLDIQYVPKRLCIVGAGVIGMEFAAAFNSFGSQVTVIEFLSECLPPIDSDIAKRLRQNLSKRGISFNLKCGVKKIEKTDGGLNITFENKKGALETVEADIVLVATGRGANVQGFGLENTGVETARPGIVVDDNMKTNVEHIYAIGDVNGRCMLAHAATFQGMRAVNHILGVKDNIILNNIPSAVFTNPEVGGVGMTEDACKAQGIEYTVKKAFYRANGKAMSMNATEGLIKLIADKDGKIIGCYLYGAHAADLAQEVSVLMAKGTTAKELADMVHIHPTLSEIVNDAAAQF